MISPFVDVTLNVNPPVMMNTHPHKYRAYVMATHTVARTRQIVMLYDGVIRFIQQAKEAIREKRIEDRYRLLIKASDVISGLQGCLDFEKGGDIARALYGFYASLDMRIGSIQHSNSLATCDEVLTDLRQMRDVWHEIDQGNGSSGDSPAGNTAAPLTNTSAPTAASNQNITLSV